MLVLTYPQVKFFLGLGINCDHAGASIVTVAYYYYSFMIVASHLTFFSQVLHLAILPNKITKQLSV